MNFTKKKIEVVVKVVHMCLLLCMCVCLYLFMCAFQYANPFLRFSESFLISAVSRQNKKASSHDDKRIGEQSHQVTQGPGNF